MATAHRVELRLGTQRLAVSAWDEVSITLDLLHPGSPWTLTLWRQERAETWDRVRAAAKIWSPVEVAVDGAVQLTGFVERMRTWGGRSGAPLTLSGRDLWGVALSADVDPRLSTHGATLEDVLERALAPLGIDLVIGALADEAREIQAGVRPGPIPRRRSSTTGRARRRQHVDRSHPKAGEKVAAFVEQLCRRHGYLAYVAPAGDGMGLVIDRPAYDSPSHYTLTRRRERDGTFTGNILDGGRDLNGTDLPTSVEIFGESPLVSRADARHHALFANPLLGASAMIAGSYPARPRYIRDPRATSLQLAQQRARRELSRAMQEFEGFVATVQGCAQGGRLWAINSMVRIDDDLTEVHADGLITRVTFKRSRREGHTTELHVVPRGAILCEPDPEV